MDLKTKKFAGHAFVVIVVEASGGFDRAAFRWCRKCGVVIVGLCPRWEAPPTYLVPGAAEVLRGGGHWGRHQQPSCALRQPVISRVAS